MRRSSTVYFFAVILVSISLISAIGCKRGTIDKRGSAAIRVGLLQHGSSIPLVVAERMKYFADHSISVQFKVVTPAQQMPSLLRNDVDVISPSSFPVIFSTYQQNPGLLQCFLVGGESTSGETIYGIVVKAQSPYWTLKDLLGKRIGSASKFTAVNLRNVLEHVSPAGAEGTIVREYNDQTLLLEGLSGGQLEAAVLDQPALSSRVIQSGFRVIEKNFRARYLFDPYWSGAGVVRTDWLRANRAKYEAFLDAIDNALQFCQEDPLRSKQLFVSQFGLKDVDPAAIGTYVYPSARFVPPTSFVRELTSLLVTNGLLAREFDGDALFYQR